MKSELSEPEDPVVKEMDVFVSSKDAAEMYAFFIVADASRHTIFSHTSKNTLSRTPR